MKPAAFPEEVLQFRIQLRGIEPPVFRVIQVTNTRTFHLLHEIIQWLFEWKNYHLYEFFVGTRHVVLPGDDYPTKPALHPRTTRLGDLIVGNIGSFIYRYDFGDDWVHDITVEKRLPPDPGVRYPICLAGARAGPPEDSGGPPGFEDFLMAWRAPDDEEHEQMRSWAGPRYDPERFDPNLVNEILKAFRAQAPKKKR